MNNINKNQFTNSKLKSGLFSNPRLQSKSKLKATDMVYIAFSAALIAICSWISIPLPTVPVTLQTFAIFTVVGLLGMKRGTLAIIVYVFLGAIGIPVFSNFSGGFGILLGNTGGYIIGFILCALVIGFITDIFGKKTFTMVISMIAGLLVCYIFGTAWFMYIYSQKSGAIGLYTVLSYCVIPFILPDAVKLALSVILVKRLSRHVKY